MKKFYFDYAAATPMSARVKKCLDSYLSEYFFNPSAGYSASLKVRQDLERARADVAKVIGAKPGEITFVAGGTEANNLAIRGIMEQYPGANCVVSEIEHPSVLRPVERFNHKKIKVDKNGRIFEAGLKELIDDNTVLVSVMYVNNEIGTVQPLAKIAKLVSDIKFERSKKGIDLPLYFHTDACQAPNYIHVLANTLGVDMMTLNGGKIYGPKQTAVLFVKTGVKLSPLILGGGQEKGTRSGTENVAGFIGFAEALKETSELREKEEKRLRNIRDSAIRYIEENIQNVTVNGSMDYRVANNIHISIPGFDNEELMYKLDDKGYMVAVGSACKASNDEPSHVLKAIGLSDDEAEGSLRITMGRDTAEDAIFGLLSELKRITDN